MANHLYDALLAPHAGSDRTFLIAPDGGRTSFDDFLQRAGRQARVLTDAGLRPGDRLAVVVEKSPDALALYAAAIIAGFVFLPLNPDYTDAEIAYFLDDSGAATLICDSRRRAGLQAVARAGGARLFCLDGDGTGDFAAAAAQAAPGFVPVPRTGEDLAALLYTSGTTGRSKGAMLSHDNLLSNAEVLRSEWRFSAEDVLLHALPIFHTHGLFVATNTCLAAGAAMLLMPRFNTDAVIAALPDVTVMMGVPTFYTRLLDHPGLTRAATAHMRLFTSGSAPLLAETHTAFSARTGQFILERYRMTETNMNTSNPYDGPRIAGTVGRPLPGVALRVADPETGAALAPGAVGVIEVRGRNVFKGYWNMPEKTAAEFRADGFFVTGDLGRIDGAGYVTIIGRQRDLVISGGHNIYPREIEEVLDAQPGVRESAVIGLPHPDLGEAAVAVVIPEPGAEVSAALLLAGAAGVLARYKLPRRIILADELPRNTMGKVQKNLLRAEHARLFASMAGDGDAPE